MCFVVMPSPQNGQFVLDPLITASPVKSFHQPNGAGAYALWQPPAFTFVAVNLFPHALHVTSTHSSVLSSSGRYRLPLGTSHCSRYVQRIATASYEANIRIASTIHHRSFYNLRPTLPNNMELFCMDEPNIGRHNIMVHHLLFA